MQRIAPTSVFGKGASTLLFEYVLSVDWQFAIVISTFGAVQKVHYSLELLRDPRIFTYEFVSPDMFTYIVPDRSGLVHEACFQFQCFYICFPASVCSCKYSNQNLAKT